MSELSPSGRAGEARWMIADALRRFGTDSGRLAHAFAARHDLQQVDVQALVAIMSGEGAGQALTPGRLRGHLGLSSGGTSYVIDRLEKAGHVRRARDHPSDSRVVHLRYTEQGMATGMAFFGPLGQLTDGIMDRFSADELTIVARFLSAAADATHSHLDTLTETLNDTLTETDPGSDQEQR